jgi:hypothetical protein
MRGGSFGNMVKKRKEVRRVMSLIRRIVLVIFVGLSIVSRLSGCLRSLLCDLVI